MNKEILLNKLEKQFSYYELVDEMQETINYSKIIEFLDNEKDQKIADLETKLAESESKRKSLEEKVKFITEEKEENFVDGQKYNELKQQLYDLPKKIVKEIENLSIFDFKAFEAFGLRRYTINELTLDTILKRFGGESEVKDILTHQHEDKGEWYE